MHRKLILKQLQDFISTQWFQEEEYPIFLKFLKFISSNPKCFERSSTLGHLTASCWILSKDSTLCLLTHHKKLNKWLQLGGHADGDSSLLNVACKEGDEESGLKSLTIKDKNIFDLSIHEIPTYKNIPAHLHYDVRFLFTADHYEPLKISNESNDLKWVSLIELENYTIEKSVLKMRNKILTFPILN